MKGSDDLFRLIHSLDKNEKRYFKLSVSKYESVGDSNYVRLFDAIDAQEEYDEDKLKKKFKGLKLGKNFPSEKNYLYRLILRTMRGFPQEDNAENRIKDLLREAEFLYRKALYDQCYKVLGKAKEIAIAFEKYLLLSEIIEAEGVLVIVMENKELLRAYLDKELPLAKLSLEKALNILEFKDPYLRTFLLTLEYGNDLRREGVFEKQEAIIRPIFSLEKQVLSFEAKHYYYHARQVYHRSAGMYREMLQDSLNDVKLYDDHPEITSEKMYQYATALGNLILSNLELYMFEESLVNLKKLRGLPTRSRAIRLKIESVYFSRTTAAYVNSGNFDMIHGIISELSDFISRNRKQLRPSFTATSYWNIVNCYFGTGNYKEALKWLNKLLNDPLFDNIRPDLMCMARLINLILHYELGNFDLLEHLVRSTSRFLDKKAFLFDFEKLLLDFFPKVMTLTSEKEKKTVFARLDADFDAVIKKWEREEVAYIDIPSWCRSKLEGRSFASIVKDDVLKRQQEMAKKHKIVY
jgi:tetratricopeptide (TPR) repeat protein